MSLQSNQSETDNVLLVIVGDFKLRACISLEQTEKDVAWAILQDIPIEVTIGRKVAEFIAEGKDNLSYKMWTVHVHESIGIGEFKELFDADPYNAVRLLEEHGTLIYDNSKVRA
jgi:hypothetical protein